MSSPSDLRQGVFRAIAAADQFLVLHQDDDGHWRDYHLAPGRAEAWTTACVGYALTCGGTSGDQNRQAILNRAAQSLLESMRPEGWGYNHRTACDADSTAWVIRFLARMHRLEPVSALTKLANYLTKGGSAQTFLEPRQFGNWAAAHADVTPMVGLALLAAREHERIDAIRAAAIAAWTPNVGWKPFWWHCNAYAVAQNIEFLMESGGVPPNLAACERERLARALAVTSAFEAGQCLTTSVILSAPRESGRFIDYLLDTQSSDGGWRPSAVLLVPGQWETTRGEAHADDRRLLSTAVSAMALKRWLATSA